MRKMYNTVIGFLCALVALLTVGGVNAQSTNDYGLPNAAFVTNAVQSPASDALTWVISIAAVSLIFGWVMRIVSKKKG